MRIQSIDSENLGHYLPQKEVVASLLLSRGGAHLLHIPWQAG